MVPCDDARVLSRTKVQTVLGTPRTGTFARHRSTLAPHEGSPVYAIAIVRYRQPLEQVVKVQDEHRTYLRGLKEAGTLLAAGPMDPRFGGMFLLRVPDHGVQAALDAVRDNDPYYLAGVAQYELIGWNVVMGKDDLDRL